MREPWARGSDEWQPSGWTYHRLEEILVGAALAGAITCVVLLVTVGGFLGWRSGAAEPPPAGARLWRWTSSSSASRSAPPGRRPGSPPRSRSFARSGWRSGWEPQARSTTAATSSSATRLPTGRAAGSQRGGADRPCRADPRRRHRRPPSRPAAVLVGGDCPVILGPLAALASYGDPPGLVMVDGHEDAYPPSASPTGEASDSEVGIALGMFDDALPPQIERLTPLLAFESVALVGPRDRAELVANAVRSLARRVWFADRRRGARAGSCNGCARGDRGGESGGSIWLHVDLDVLRDGGVPRRRLPAGRRPELEGAGRRRSGRSSVTRCARASASSSTTPT